MISSVGSATQMQAIQSTQSTQAKMTADQKDQLQELLGEFSVDSFSSDDATSMVDAIKEGHIVGICAIGKATVKALKVGIRVCEVEIRDA